jgi:hypothetical protein
MPAKAVNPLTTNVKIKASNAKRLDNPSRLSKDTAPNKTTKEKPSSKRMTGKLNIKPSFPYCFK